VSVAGLPNSKLKGAGKAFLTSFAKANKGKAPDPVLGHAAPGSDRDAVGDLEVETLARGVTSQIFRSTGQHHPGQPRFQRAG